MALCEISDIELYTGTTITETVNEALMTSLINSVSAEIETICNRKFNLDTYDQTYDMDGRNINLKQSPIVSITSIEYGSPFNPSERTALETDQYFTHNDEGIISLLLRFNRAEQWVNVVYSAGYATIPDDITAICVKYVVSGFNSTSVNTNIKKEKIGDYSYELSSEEERKEQMRNDLSKWIRCVY